MDRVAQIQDVLHVVTVALLVIIALAASVRLGWAAYLAHVDRHIERKRAADMRARKDQDTHG